MTDKPPPNEDGNFTKYTTHGGGSILKALLPAGSPEAETGTLATIAGGMDIAACNDDEPDSGPVRGRRQ